MATRGSDSRLDILPETPGTQHLGISGTRLPTYNQVILCYLANFEKLRREDSTRQNEITVTVVQVVLKEVLQHYHKSNILTVSERSMEEKVQKLLIEYKKLQKVNCNIRSGDSNISKFNEKLQETMPFWPKDVIKKMEESKKGKSVVEKML